MSASDRAWRWLMIAKARRERLEQLVARFQLYGIDPGNFVELARDADASVKSWESHLAALLERSVRTPRAVNEDDDHV